MKKIYFLLTFIAGYYGVGYTQTVTSYGGLTAPGTTSATAGNNTNAYFGHQAGSPVNVGIRNTFIGYQSGLNNTDGIENSALGSLTLSTNTVGARNTANGIYALYGNTSGSENTGIGYAALGFSTTGNGNVANGFQASLNNTSGSYNVAIGYQALTGNSLGSGNVAIGYNAGTITSNGLSNITTLGYMARASASNGTAVGSNASSVGSNSTAIGNGAVANAANSVQLGNASVTQVFAGTGANATLIAGGLQITGGTLGVGRVLTSDANGVATWQLPAGGGGGGGWSLTGNIGTVDGDNFIGTVDNVPFTIRVNSQRGGRIESSGLSANTFYGYLSGNANTGSANTAYGCTALTLNTTGSNNAADGYQALNNNTTGSNNTANGSFALYWNTTGNNNTALGYNTGPAMGGGAFTNATVIGNGATMTASNQVRIGNNAVTSIGGFVNWSNISDARFKKNVQEDVAGLAFIEKLRPVSYELDRKKLDTFLRGETATEVTGVSGERSVGFIAQEVEQVVNENRYVFSGVDKPQNEYSHYGLRYAEFVVPLVKAVQELSAENKAQQELIGSLQQLVVAQQVELETLKSALYGSPTKTNTSGKTGAESEPQPLPGGFALYQNVPNPFDRSTVIGAELPESVQQAKIVVYNLQGLELASYPLSERGKVSVEISGGRFPAGMYLYALLADGQVIDTKKMILTD